MFKAARIRRKDRFPSRKQQYYKMRRHHSWLTMKLCWPLSDNYEARLNNKTKTKKKKKAETWVISRLDTISPDKSLNKQKSSNNKDPVKGNQNLWYIKCPIFSQNIIRHAKKLVFIWNFWTPYSPFTLKKFF